MKRTRFVLFLLLTVGAWGQQADIPKSFTPPTSDYDYEKREVMILMRDGVKLHTVIVVPKGARNAPILLTRTPYNASKRASRNESPHMLATLPLSDEVFVNDGYIRVYQDVRGKYKSEGAYLMTRPVRGPLNDSSTDHVTDAYDTIDWLVKNVPESNGKVGVSLRPAWFPPRPVRAPSTAPQGPQTRFLSWRDHDPDCSATKHF